MRIGLVCPYNMWGGGGVQECVLALQSELTARGHHVKIITPLPRGHNGKKRRDVLTVGVSTNIRAFSATQTQFSATVEVDAINLLLNKEKFDVLHFHEPSIPVLNRQILVRSRSANVATSHATIPDGMMSKTIINMFNAYTKGLIKYIHTYSAVSEPAAMYIRGFTNEKIVIIPNGIDLKKYKETEKKAVQHKTILYIGRLEKRKGLKYLLEAFQLLTKNHPDARLLIAGDGPLRSKLEEWVHENKVPRVKFLGFISDRRKLSLLNSADLFCSPALYGESFGIVLLEAMAMGLVTVAGNNPGYASVMKGEGRNSLVDPQNTKRFVSKLETYLYDEKERNRWKKWAKGYVKQFDYPKIVDQYEKLYKTGLKNSKR